MLAYQHAYHAGNFADVHKHLTLYSVQQYLLRKNSPVTYCDTHAGRGLYPLVAEETQRLKEYQDGVARLWSARQRLAEDELLRDWTHALARLQRGETLSHYPGSPWWFSQALRRQDRLTLYELHPGEHRHLEEQALPANARRLHSDGLAGLLKILPVTTPRLCVLIDPSYENKAEYTEVAATLAAVASKARHAIVMIWYPLLPAGRHQHLLDELKACGLRKLWRSELRLHDPQGSEHTHGMYGSGMLVFNPPWGLDVQLSSSLGRVAELLGKPATHRGEWWVGE
ncbi:23S rRNA (adenine(2030)-N(6))-methyltransferase RlmJ [Halomonas sp. WWR20]